MSMGIVSDTHGNAVALVRAFNPTTDADMTACLDDAIKQYKFSNRVVSMLMERRAYAIVGSHEEAFFGRGGTGTRALGPMDRAALCWLRMRPDQLTKRLLGKVGLFVHSTPRTPTGAYVTLRKATFARFGNTGAGTVLYGHIYQPVATRFVSTLDVNPGSVGEPDLEDASHNGAVLQLARETVRRINSFCPGRPPRR